MKEPELPKSRVTGRRLARQYGLEVKHALYRKTGDWYHSLKQFPSALFDDQGYVVFSSEGEYRSCQQLQFGKDVHVPNGIRTIPGYELR